MASDNEKINESIGCLWKYEDRFPCLKPKENTPLYRKCVVEIYCVPLVENPLSLQQFTWDHALTHTHQNPFFVFSLHNYRIIASVFLTQQGVFNHWNCEITDWDGMGWSAEDSIITHSCPPLWWMNRQEGGSVSAGTIPPRSASPQPALGLYRDSTKAPTHLTHCGHGHKESLPVSENRTQLTVLLQAYWSIVSLTRWIQSDNYFFSIKKAYTLYWLWLMGLKVN